MSFANRVTALAARLHMSQSDTARACGVAPQSAQRWFTGASLPRQQHLPALAAALQVTVNELVEGVPELEHLASAMGMLDQDQLQGSVTEHFRQFTETRARFRKARDELNRVSYRVIQDVARRLTEHLVWGGYEVVEDDATGGYAADRGRGILEVIGPQGRLYQLHIRLAAPTSSDLSLLKRMRYIRTREHVPGTPEAHALLVYAFPDERDDSLHYLMFSATQLDRPETLQAFRQLSEQATTCTVTMGEWKSKLDTKSPLFNQLRRDHLNKFELTELVES